MCCSSSSFVWKMPTTHTEHTTNTHTRREHSLSSIQLLLHAISRPANGLFVGRRVTTISSISGYYLYSGAECCRLSIVQYVGYAWDAVISFRNAARAIHSYSIECPTLCVQKKRNNGTNRWKTERRRMKQALSRFFVSNIVPLLAR